MTIFQSSDGTDLFFKDWGAGQPVLFSHGWPLTADAWDGQMQFLGENGFRVIAHDRRSHGRSAQTWDSNHMDRYADDLAELIDHLDLDSLIMVGHSTGGGEVARYIGRHGTRRVAKVVLVGAVPPLMVQTDANPDGLPLGVFDGIRKGTRDNRAQFYKDLTLPFYGYIAAMFTEVQRHGGGLAEALNDEDADIRQALRVYLGGYLSPRHRDRPDGGCPLPTLAADLARTDGLARENFVSGIDRMTMRIQTALARLGRSRAEADARAVVAQMVGAVGLARAVGVGAQSDAFLRDCLDALLTKLDL